MKCPCLLPRVKTFNVKMYVCLVYNHSPLNNYSVSVLDYVARNTAVKLLSRPFPNANYNGGGWVKITPISISYIVCLC